LGLPLAEARAQVFEICADNYISIVFVKPWQAVSALLGSRTILIRPIRSTITYVTTLHELGHILNPRSLNARGELVCEAQAWAWARKKALYWNTTAEHHKNLCLYLYLQAEDRPAANHVFWKVYKS